MYDYKMILTFEFDDWFLPTSNGSSGSTKVLNFDNRQIGLEFSSVKKKITMPITCYRLTYYYLNKISPYNNFFQVISKSKH